MPSYNRVILMGHLTRDPELKELQNGSVCNFGIAVNESWKDKSGEKQERVTFVDCTAWNGTGEAIAKYLEKGRAIHIEGRLQQDQWEDKDGQKRSKLKVVVESFQFADSKRDDARDQRQSSNTTSRGGGYKAKG